MDAAKRRAVPRQKLLENLVRARAADAAFGDAEKWLNDNRASVEDEAPVSPAAGDDIFVAAIVEGDQSRIALRPTPLLGVCVVSLSTEEDVKNLQASLSGYDVIADHPLPLIPPVAGTQTMAPGSKIKPLWAARVVNATPKHRNGHSGKGVTVAVLDCGVDGAHRELNPRVSDQVYYDPDSKKKQPETPTDAVGHGTHVAGIIAGARVGVAPGAKIFSGRFHLVLDNLTLLSSFVVLTEVACSRGATVINISAGVIGFLPDAWDYFRDELLGADIVPVCAVGNEGAGKTRSPGNYACALSVGACNVRGDVAPFSGSGHVEHEGKTHFAPHLVAPGVDILSCVPSSYASRGYTKMSGTSMSAPLVSGICALLWEAYPGARAVDIVDAILATCEKLRDVPDDRQGAGRIDYVAAQRHLRSRSQS